MGRGGLMPSIKLRLVVIFAAVFSVVLAALGLSMYVKLKDIAIGSIDSHLHSEVQLIAGLITSEREDLEVELHKVETGDYAVALSGHYFQVVSENGELIARSPSLSLANVTLPLRGKEAFFEPVLKNITGPDNKPHRLMEQSFNVYGKVVTVQASESLADVYALLSTFRRTLLIAFPLIFMFTSAAVVVVTGFSLRSLDVFARQLGHITEKSLSERVNADNLPRELKPLASNFNVMIERLEESFERQRSFLTDASHQLRTPLSIVKSTCDVTLAKDRTADEYREALLSVSGSLSRMTALTERIMDAARFESRIFSMNMAEVDLTGILEDCVRLLADKALSRSVSIALSGARTRVFGDREKLTDLFLTITDNAVKYNRQGGRVAIEVKEGVDEAVVTIEDTGRGIPAGEREKVFDRFFRGADTGGVEPGSGLGLSIAKTLAARHGGGITLESEVGKGSVFKVILPKKDKKD